jgi:hypothetical protein
LKSPKSQRKSPHDKPKNAAPATPPLEIAPPRKHPVFLLVSAALVVIWISFLVWMAWWG